MLRVAEHFRDHEHIQSRNQTEANRRKWFIAARDQRERKQEMDQRADDDLFDIATSVIVATEIEIQQFHAKLDTYDEAAVKALMENTELLAVVEARIQEHLKHAHVMEDGTRVFKSEDGTWGVDEHGKRFDGRTHDMDTIPATKVTADEFLVDFKERDFLQRQRMEIIEYQDKLDNAREQSSVEGFSKEDMDAMDAELEADMPIAVERQLPDYDPSQEISLQSDFAATAPKLSSITPQAGMEKGCVVHTNELNQSSSPPKTNWQIIKILVK